MAYRRGSTTFCVYVSAGIGIERIMFHPSYSHPSLLLLLLLLLASLLGVQTIKLESLGDSITTAVLLSWNKQPGDAVAEDDVIGVVETDKVTMDIRAKVSGVMGEHLCAAGDEINVGADIYKVDTAATGGKVSASVPRAADTDADAASTSASAPAPAGPADNKTVDVPIMGESITTGNVSEWLAGVGDYVEVDQVVAMIETDKVTVEVRSPHAGEVTGKSSVFDVSHAMSCILMYPDIHTCLPNFLFPFPPPHRTPRRGRL